MDPEIIQRDWLVRISLVVKMASVMGAAENSPEGTKPRKPIKVDFFGAPKTKSTIFRESI